MRTKKNSRASGPFPFLPHKSGKQIHDRAEIWEIRAMQKSERKLQFHAPFRFPLFRLASSTLHPSAFSTLRGPANPSLQQGVAGPSSPPPRRHYGASRSRRSGTGLGLTGRPVKTRPSAHTNHVLNPWVFASDPLNLDSPVLTEPLWWRKSGRDRLKRIEIFFLFATPRVKETGLIKSPTSDCTRLSLCCGQALRTAHAYPHVCYMKPSPS
ncbi:hypothetical protein N656DRAFT_624964 [Canariomyces notabilis]|uniref:Uncharacterized protein n=1 Tax=Canariomyces notabilis TaxID=2074819 RepID=A0AAN6TFN3_9PEZI|nr:hypothetical protein N656DRAFT_624964 [Canariomyces arenarius]